MTMPVSDKAIELHETCIKEGKVLRLTNTWVEIGWGKYKKKWKMENPFHFGRSGELKTLKVKSWKFMWGKLSMAFARSIYNHLATHCHAIKLISSRLWYKLPLSHPSSFDYIGWVVHNFQFLAKVREKVKWFFSILFPSVVHSSIFYTFAQLRSAHPPLHAGWK